MISNRIIQLAVVLVAAVILLVVVLKGSSTGKLQAQSQIVSSNASVLADGLNYFYSDEERYPTADEYQSNSAMMLKYFSGFPPAAIPSKNCPSSFSYQHPSYGSYKLSFCIPLAWNGFNA